MTYRVTVGGKVVEETGSKSVAERAYRDRIRAGFGLRHMVRLWHGFTCERRYHQPVV